MNRLRRALPASIALATALVAPTLSAQTRPSSSSSSPSSSPPPVAVGPHRIDPRVTTVFAHRTRFGGTLPVYRRSLVLERDGTLPVVVRFASAPSAATLARLATRGVVWARGGRALASGAFSARVSEAAVAALEAESTVRRVEIDLPFNAPRPLDLSVRETHIDVARRAVMAADGTTLDGRGVVIGDVDSALFVFHPGLFNADGGAVAWVDANHDGTFTPGTDGVDLDGDGTVGPNETLTLLATVAYDERGGTIAEGTPGTFRPDLDWLYVDANGDHRRNYGTNDGFDDTAPALGEPTFVADDADHDGRLEPSERLLRLGTSKVRAVLADQEYDRGSTPGLSEYVHGTDAAGWENAMHATGVAGILVGGVPNVSRWLGLAPRAELLVADDTALASFNGTTQGLQWLMDQGANVLLTEYAPYAGVTLDGSSEEEQLLDAALAQNVVPVSPAGNLAVGYKHRAWQLAPGDNALPAHTDAMFTGGTLIQLSTHYRGDARHVAYSLVMPDGNTVTLPDSSPRGTTVDGQTVYVTDDVTSRGTHEHHIQMYNRAGLPEGAYELHATLDAGAPLAVDVYVGDDRASWAGGFTLMQNDGTRTICHPSTSDQTISVSAYVLHGDAAYAAWGPAGALAGYSSVGPRIDGDTGIDIAGPDNPMSLTPPQDGRYGDGAWMPFGGTSGASPHVTAAAALLRQRFPDESATALRARLLEHARHDANATADAVTSWGHGKLDLAAAAELTAADGRAPALTLRAPEAVMVGTEAVLSLTVDDDEPADALRARWDYDYDGNPDTDWIPLGDAHVPAPTLGVLNPRVEVHDGQGHLVAATALISVVSSLPPSARDGGADGGDGHSGGACGCAVPAHSDVRGSLGALAAAAAGLIAARRRRRGAPRALGARAWRRASRRG